MKFLDRSGNQPKRLFVAISEFEFNGFSVRVRRLALRESRATQDVFRITRSYLGTLGATSPIQTAI
jgi:hypothetical protein